MTTTEECKVNFLKVPGSVVDTGSTIKGYIKAIGGIIISINNSSYAIAFEVLPETTNSQPLFEIIWKQQRVYKSTLQREIKLVDIIPTFVKGNTINFLSDKYCNTIGCIMDRLGIFYKRHQ